jgi:hypothetical protein
MAEHWGGPNPGMEGDNQVWVIESDGQRFFITDNANNFSLYDDYKDKKVIVMEGSSAGWQVTVDDNPTVAMEVGGEYILPALSTTVFSNTSGEGRLYFRTEGVVMNMEIGRH